MERLFLINKYETRVTWIDDEDSDGYEEETECTAEGTALTFRELVSLIEDGGFFEPSCWPLSHYNTPNVWLSTEGYMSMDGVTTTHTLHIRPSNGVEDKNYLRAKYRAMQCAGIKCRPLI